MQVCHIAIIVNSDRSNCGITNIERVIGIPDVDISVCIMFEILIYFLLKLSGFIVYNVTYKGTAADQVRCFVQVFDKNDTQVTAYNDCAGLLEIGNAHFWWPYLMHPEPGYLYSFKVIRLF